MGDSIPDMRNAGLTGPDAHAKALDYPKKLGKRAVTERSLMYPELAPLGIGVSISE